jgi:hypothetical protein
MNADPDFSTRDTSESHLITQAELNKLVQDLDLSKTDSAFWITASDVELSLNRRKRQSNTDVLLNGSGSSVLQ